MEKASIALRRSVASCALLSLCAHVGTAAATDSPSCASGGGTGVSNVSVAALTRDGRLLCFKRGGASRAREIGYVQGLMSGDTRLVGIDYRVQDGLLYGVGNGGGVYRIDTDSAAAEFVNRLSVPLSGASFGVDFNPAADRLRIISDNGQNLRHNVNAGGTTLADTTLNYTTGVAATGISGAAYTNNDLDASTATSLFDMDTTLDQTVLQSPPNAGAVAPTGKLAVDAGAQVGFDIYSFIQTGRARANLGFAVVSTGGVSRFYNVNLLTGRLFFLGRFGTEVIDVAVPLAQ
jgi:Domain of unknown function (DUF4394)